VMVALVFCGETVAGWIHDPLGGETVVAARGAGAWNGGRRLAAAPPRALKQMTGVLYIGARRAPALHARIKSMAGELGPTSFNRSAGIEYLGLARARFHYAIFTRLLPWDHAPGVLMFEEAGGHVAYWDGEPYRPTAARPVPLLAAPSEASWRELHTVFGS